MKLFGFLRLAAVVVILAIAATSARAQTSDPPTLVRHYDELTGESVLSPSGRYIYTLIDELYVPQGPSVPPGADLLGTIDAGNPADLNGGGGAFSVDDNEAVYDWLTLAPYSHYVYLIAYQPVTGTGALEVFEVGDPDYPTREVQIELEGWSGEGASMAVDGDYVYVSSYYELYILSAITPSAPSLVGATSVAEGVVDIEIAGSRAYLAVGSDGVSIMDISNKAAPYEIDYIVTTITANAVEVTNGYAYVFDGDETICAYDLSASPPEEAGCLDMNLDGSTNHMVARNGYLYVSLAAAGVHIINAYNPADMFEETSYPSEHAAYEVLLRGDYIFVPMLTQGMDVLEWEEPLGGWEGGGSGAGAAPLIVDLGAILPKANTVFNWLKGNAQGVIALAIAAGAAGVGVAAWRRQ